MSNELMQKVEAKAVAKTTGGKTLYDLVKSMGPQFAMALPRHIKEERFIRIALTCLRTIPKLAQCSQESFLGALMQAAQAGLEPGVLNQCHIIPFKGEAKLVYGYQGLLLLVRRSGEIKDIFSEIIYENDEWDIILGDEKKLKHKPLLSGADRGKPILVYSVATFENGSKSFDFMTMTDIEKIKKASPSSSYSDSPWKNWPEAMMKKTVLKRHTKTLPLSSEIMAHIQADETVKKEIAPDMAIDVLPIEIKDVEEAEENKEA
jgi:recombination protein RecT